MLEKAGIESIDDVRALGPVVSFLAVRQSGAKPSLNLLWALFAALNGKRWTEVSKEEKRRLLAEVEDAIK